MTARSFMCTAADMHPFECDGPGRCIHHDRRVVVASSDEGTNYYSHDPSTCALCDPEYDYAPNPWWDERVEQEARRAR